VPSGADWSVAGWIGMGVYQDLVRNLELS